MSIRMLLLALVLGLTTCGCSNGQTGYNGDWHGTITFSDATAAQTMDWAIFDPPGEVAPTDFHRVVLDLSGPSTCALHIDYGTLKFGADGTVAFPMEKIAESDCTPSIDAADLTNGGELDLVLTGRFFKAEGVGRGTFELRTSRGGTIIKSYRTGNWVINIKV